MVENGAAPDERFPQMMTLSMKPSPHTIEGYSVAVYEDVLCGSSVRTVNDLTSAAVCFQQDPFMVLYIRPEK